MTRARRAMLAASALAALAASAGCAPKFDHLEITAKADPPLTAVVSEAGIQIPEGVVVAVTARPIAEGGQVMPEDTYVDFKPKDPTVLGVAFALPQTPSQDPTAAEWSFVLVGARAGMTTVDLRVGDETRATIPAVIEAQ